MLGESRAGNAWPVNGLGLGLTEVRALVRLAGDGGVQ
jgi:hypothetical protein